nr:VWA domain-containing protein [Massilistercora timonensis]
MFCGNCGHQIEDDALFCPNCGAKVEGAPEEPEKQAQQEPALDPGPAGAKKPPKGGQKKKRSQKPLIAAVIAVVLVFLLAGGGTVYATAGLTMQKDKALSQVEECGFQEYEEQAKAAAEEWKGLGILDVGKKQDVIKELKSVKEDLDDFIGEQMDFYESVDMSEAEKAETESYEKELQAVEQATGNKKPDYPAVKKAFEELDSIVFQYVEPEQELTVDVQQVDASEFPTVRLYVNVEDPATGEVPEDLDSMLFYIEKEDANAEYVRQTVTAANQLNEKEALKVDMVADVSGSMNGSPLNEAKNIMNNFINSVQFEAGDLVELTSFSTGVRLEQEFCDDPDLLTQKVNQLFTDDMTSLYDALYTSVERVAAQNGARCVIAFTDGNDNYSNCSQEDVIQVANRYHVPVFIIGIGSIDASRISYIAEQTGGKYYSISDVYSMESIYQEIYEMEKQMYLLEFEDSTGATVDDKANIQVGYHSREYGGECQYSYEPNVLLSAKAATVYEDGPEAVVEKYLKNFPDAVTNNDFSLISDCLKPGSAIYQEQEKYVQRDISERLDSYEITDVSYNGNNNCVVSTRETYYVQVAGKPLQLMTQECQYALENAGGTTWYMTDFVDLKVVSRIKQ